MAIATLGAAPRVGASALGVVRAVFSRLRSGGAARIGFEGLERLGCFRLLVRACSLAKRAHAVRASAHSTTLKMSVAFIQAQLAGELKMLKYTVSEWESVLLTGLGNRDVGDWHAAALQPQVDVL